MHDAARAAPTSVPRRIPGLDDRSVIGVLQETDQAAWGREPAVTEVPIII